MIVNVLTDDGTTVEIIQSSLPNVVEVYQTTAPEVVEIVTAGPQGPAGPTASTASFVTTSSFNAFTSSYNTGSFIGSFTGNLTGTASWATNALTASYLSGYVSPFPYTGSARITGSLGITGSLEVLGLSTLYGTQTITGSNGRLIYTGTTPGAYPTLAEVHINNDYPWLHRFYNDTFSTSSAVMAYFGWNDGRFVFHNESTQSIGLQVNGFEAENGLLVYSNKVAFVNNVEVTGSLNVVGGITGSLFGTASWASNAISSSYTLSASWAPSQNINTSSLVTTSSFNSFTSSYNTGSFTGSFTGSLQGTATTASYVQNAQSASYVLQAVSSSYALSSSFAATSSYSTNFTISGSINNVDYIDFNPTKYDTITSGVIPAQKEGRLFYDTGSQTLCMYNAEVDVTLNIGQESWLRARNQTGTTITNGSVVRISGSIGSRPTVVLAQAVDQVQTFGADNDVIGMATHDIEQGTDGFITTFGLVNGVNTAAFTAGDLLWVSSSAGKYTNIAPSAPIDKTFVGIVTRANVNNGSIFVTPNQPIHFHDLSSVSASVYTQGDIWMFKQSGSSGVWNNTKTLSGSYSISGNLTVTGSMIGTSSWASNATTASYVQNAQTASYVLQAISSSFASTASFAPNYVLTSSTSSMLQPYVLSSNTSSFVTNSQTSSFVLNSVTSSMLTPYVLTSSTSSMSVATASYALNIANYNYKNTTTSSAVTGSVSETQVLQVIIPANTFASSDFFRIYLQMVKTGTSAASSINVKMSTSNTMPAGAASRIALYTLPAASLFGGVSRTFAVKGGNIEGFPQSVSSPDGLANSTTTLASNTFNPAVTQYLYVSITNGDTTVSTILNSIQISST